MLASTIKIFINKVLVFQEIKNGYIWSLKEEEEECQMGIWQKRKLHNILRPWEEGSSKEIQKLYTYSKG
jgi:hypothetical protein